jgi:serine/threonine protein kinase
MANTSTACPAPAELAKLLESSRAGDAAHDELTVHLETCGRCQTQLEQLAAGALTWDDVARRLKAGCSGGSPAQASAPLSAPRELAEAIAALKTQTFDSAGPQLADLSPDLPAGFLQPAREPGHFGQLGEFDVIEEVGRGAMGVVLRAFDRRLHRMVAIKVMSPQLASMPLARQRFVREGHSAAAVCHEHVVTIYAVAEHAGLPYLVMQYVSGKTLQQRLDQAGPLRTAEILRIGMQAAAGLAAAHAQGLVHRDIKPANLLLENGVERVKLTDFGLARAVDDASITQTGVITGTPQFMAPEQARGEPLDGRADLFSLGCVLYALAAGRPPFRASTTLAVLKKICEEEPRPIRELNPEIPEWLAAIIRKLLAKESAARIASAAELAELLEQCLAHVQRPERIPLPPTAAELASRPVAPLADDSRTTPERLVAPARAVWLQTPWGIAALIAAMILPLAFALFNNWVDWRFGPRRTPNEQVEPTSASGQTVQPFVPVSKAVRTELERLVAVAEQQFDLARQRHQAGIVATGELLEAEVGWREAQAELARANADRGALLAALSQLVALREQQVDVAQQRIAAAIAPPGDDLTAKQALLKARLELEREKSVAPN